MVVHLFPAFQAAHPNWQTEQPGRYTIQQKDSDIYQRMAIAWKESKKYHAVININTGEIYNNWSKTNIFFRHLKLIITLPIHTCIKTLWHASIIGPLAYEIFKCTENKQTAKELGLNMLKSFADIVRTPLYGIAMTIVNIGAVVIGVFSPNSLYKTREIVGQLERTLYRVDRSFQGCWPCASEFSPIDSIQHLYAAQLQNESKDHLTLYQHTQTLYELLKLMSARQTVFLNNILAQSDSIPPEEREEFLAKKNSSFVESEGNYRLQMLIQDTQKNVDAICTTINAKQSTNKKCDELLEEAEKHYASISHEDHIALMGAKNLNELLSRRPACDPYDSLITRATLGSILNG